MAKKQNIEFAYCECGCKSFVNVTGPKKGAVRIFWDLKKGWWVGGHAPDGPELVKHREEDAYRAARKLLRELA